MNESRRLVGFVDLAIALTTFVVAGMWGTHYWNAARAAGQRGFFYQEYFEPAVMTACGRGFVVTEPRLATVTDFLANDRASFDCGDIPATVTYRFATFQAPWRYLMLSVAATWKIRGISWGALGPLAGVLFGASVAVMYGIFRLGMGRVFALAGAFSFAVGPIHLMEVPHLRDYSKAPFALMCLLILGVLVTRRLGRRAMLALSGLYGAVVAAGYGFRSDLLIYLPPFFVTLAFFLPDGLKKNIGSKVLGVLVCIVTFACVSYPMVSVVTRNGSCVWHFMLLGFTNTFAENLRVIPGPYDWGHRFSDRWVFATLQAFSERRHDDFTMLDYCSTHYDAVGREYAWQILQAFPGDIATRATASVLGIVREAFWRPPLLADFAPSLYMWRERFLRHLPGSGLAWVVGALLMTIYADLRVGLFLLFFVLYFGGYPAIQFHPRHMFHLEFMPWWAIGFVVWQSGRAALGAALSGLRPAIDWAAVRRACVAAAATAAVFALAVVSLRAIQDAGLRRLFGAYLAAVKQDLHYEPMTPGSLHAIAIAKSRGYPSAFLQIDLRTAACAPMANVTARYESRPDGDLSRTIVLDRQSPDVTHIFTPVYEFFRGVEFSDERPGCVVGVFQIADVRPFPILMNATLYPGWSNEPLHQQMSSSVLE